MVNDVPRQYSCRCLLGLGLTLVLASVGQGQQAAPQPQLAGGNLATPAAEPGPVLGGPYPLLALFGLPAGARSRTDNGDEGEQDEIETDRDSFTPSKRLVAPGRFIVEAANSYIDNRGVAATQSFPELLVRYGLMDRIELRLGWNYEIGGAKNNVSGVDAGDDGSGTSKALESDSTFNYGLKVLLTKTDGWVPGSAAIVQASTPTSGKANDTQIVATYVLGWTLPNRWVLDAAMRYGTGGEASDRYSTWAPSTVLKVPLTDKWSVHAEYFGIFSTGKDQEFTQHYASSGVHYLVTSNIEIGVRFGWGLNDQSARFFSNVGVGWRF